MSLEKWKKLSSEPVCQAGQWFRVRKDKVIAPSGQEGVYYVIEKPAGVFVIPMDKDGHLYLVRLHRYTHNKFFLEFPTGARETKDKSFLAAAKRELEEETGLVSSDWIRLGKFHENNENSNTRCMVFLARNVISKPNPIQDPQDKNLHRLEVYSYSEVKNMIRDGKLTDASTLAALAIAESCKIFK